MGIKRYLGSIVHNREQVKATKYLPIGKWDINYSIKLAVAMGTTNLC